MNNFYTRLSQLSEYKGFKSVNKFALAGLNYSSSEKLNRLKKENTNPSVEILLDISNKFEDVNIDWLLTGKGNMIRGLERKEEINPMAEKDNYIIELQKKEIATLEEKLQQCQDEKKLLENNKLNV